MRGFITLEPTCPSAAAQQRQNGTKSVFPQVGGLITSVMRGFITSLMKGFITSSHLVDRGP